jgi:putrescine transport system ATP-binding protein
MALIKEMMAFWRGRTAMRQAIAPRAAPGTAPLVRFDAVCKRFGAVAAVDRLSLDIYEREFFALLGPSGCGKTTLLRLLAGFEMPDEGRILLAGEDIAAVPPFRRPTNMMFQSYALFPHLTVAGNIAFGLKQDGLAKADIARRVEEMLVLVKLRDCASRKPHQLSGGQRQRVALARSLAKRPKVLLLDEPMAALDRKLREETQFELVELQSQLGTAFVIVTHDQEEAMTVAHRIGVMDGGRLAQVATPSEIYERPNSRWVAQFIGDINVFEGRIASADAGGTLIEDGKGRRFRLQATNDVALGATAFVALRPEKIEMSTTAPAEAQENCVAGRVRDIGYLGDVSVYKVLLEDGSEIRVSLANRSSVLERSIDRDAQVWLTWTNTAGVLLTR